MRSRLRDSRRCNELSLPDDLPEHIPHAAEELPHVSCVNPYSVAPSDTDDGMLASRLPENAAAEPLATRRERIWTSFAIVALSLVSILLFSFIMRGVTVWVLGTQPLSWNQFLDEAALKEAFRSRWGLFLLVVVPQFGLVLPSLVAAWLSPVGFCERLGLVRGRWPIWAWIAAAIMTPLIGLISTILIGLFVQESEALKELSDIFRAHVQGGFLIPLALMVGATPAVCEEILFRGYVQTRLTRSLRPSIGIAFASVLFAAFHMDYVHALGVLPLGLFLGWITWQAGSLFPAMLSHFVNNAMSVVLMSLAGGDDVASAPITPASVLVVLGVFCSGVCGVCGVLAARILYGRPEAMSQASDAQTP